MSQDCKTCAIYVPSYRRSDDIKTWHILNDCTYVVRKSEEEAYRKAGVTKILAAPDEEIDSLPKVRQWIIDNTPEDIVIQVDDDLSRFSYANKTNIVNIEDKDTIDMELERIAQLISDLGIGFAALPMQENVLKYTREFSFKSTIGLVCWFNKDGLKKSRYDEKIRFKADMDFELQELLHNRIILIPEYLRVKAVYDKNAGGNSVTKNTRTVQEAVEYMRSKWGCYYSHNYKSNTSKVNVRR